MKKRLIILVGLIFILVGCEKKESYDYTHTHSNIFVELHRTIDSDLVNHYNNVFVEHYVGCAGEDGEWSDYAVETKEDKIDLLNSWSEGIIALDKLQKGLTDNEAMNLKELHECMFARLVHSEYNETTYCEQHDNKEN